MRTGSDPYRRQRRVSLNIQTSVEAISDVEGADILR